MTIPSIVVVAAGAAVAAVCAAGCSVNAGVSASVTAPPNCTAAPALSCIRGANGWTCPAGDNPEAEVSGLSCSIPTPDGPNDDFCCFDWTFGSSCTPDDTITSVCQPGSFGYTCVAMETPNSLDPTLNCSTPTPDGPNDDFCCN
jgi:hypothetical protein